MQYWIIAHVLDVMVDIAYLLRWYWQVMEKVTQDARIQLPVPTIDLRQSFPVCIIHFPYVHIVWLAGQVARVPDLRSTGYGFESRLPHCWVQPWASCLHTCASVTKQYNLIPASGRWCSAAGEVTPGLAENNGSLPPGLLLRSSAGWLPRTGINSRTLHSFRVWGLYLTCILC